MVGAAVALLAAPAPRTLRSLRGNLAFWGALGFALMGAAATATTHGLLQRAEARAAVWAQEPGAQRYRQLLSDQAYLQTHEVPRMHWTVQADTGTYDVSAAGRDALCTWAALGWPTLGIELRGTAVSLRPQATWTSQPEPRTRPPLGRAWVDNGCRSEQVLGAPWRPYAEVTIRPLPSGLQDGPGRVQQW